MEVVPDQASKPQSVFRSMPTLPSASIVSSQKPIDTDLAGWRAHLIDADVKPDRIASPDLSRQLAHAMHAKIDTLVCCVLDTDPSVLLQTSIAAAYSNELAAGVNLLAKLTSAPRVWITADPEKPAGWYAALQTKLNHPGLRRVPLRGDYPQTDPTLLLHTLLERPLRPGQLPTEKNVLLVDAAAAVAIGQCVLHDQPKRETALAVRDHFHRQTHFVTAPNPASVGEVCAFLKIDQPDPVFRAGDFLRDLWLLPDQPIGHGELIIHITARHLDANPDPCIRCGWCVEACPTQIHPAGLLGAAQCDDLQSARGFGLNACIECGICSYVCPTRLPLLSSIRGLKARR